ncbi:unnamed protein product [Rotaria sp. Silwood2]|nr:unnamed protein product [Rotaria sp. Silwood2]CAF2799891.1 unnamed protein product [Rotaria sp. Silwood2]CAF3208667.1 unnamed protein product [Rotaria sp. Silwood2]
MDILLCTHHDAFVRWRQQCYVDICSQKGRILSPIPWLLCHGQAVSRIEYERLFSVIGTTYGIGDDSTTFNVPDFRGRFPLGVDETNLTVANAGKLGLLGGNSSHELTVKQLPPHKHDGGSYRTGTDGYHTYGYHDPGYDHGGRTGSEMYGRGHYEVHGTNRRTNEDASHSHTIAQDTTHITIYEAGSHSHSVQEKDHWILDALICNGDGIYLGMKTCEYLKMKP